MGACSPVSCSAITSWGSPQTARGPGRGGRGSWGGFWWLRSVHLRPGGRRPHSVPPAPCASAWQGGPGLSQGPEAVKPSGFPLRPPPPRVGTGRGSRRGSWTPVSCREHVHLAWQALWLGCTLLESPGSFNEPRVRLHLRDPDE